MFGGIWLNHTYSFGIICWFENCLKNRSCIYYLVLELFSLYHLINLFKSKRFKTWFHQEISFPGSRWSGWIWSTDPVDHISRRSSLTSSTSDLPRASKDNWLYPDWSIRFQSTMSNKLDSDLTAQLEMSQVALIPPCSYSAILIHNIRML